MAESKDKRSYRYSNGNICEIESISCNAKLIFNIKRAELNLFIDENGDDEFIIGGKSYRGTLYASTPIESWILNHIINGYSPELWRVSESDIDKEYIEGLILPLYENFDAAHQKDHATSVIENSIESANEIGVNPAICYAAALYHDIGLQISRENHHKDSAILFREDSYALSVFNEKAIALIAEAIEDHRASATSLPRSIFGIIVADSDRLLDPFTVIKRTIKFSLANYSGDANFQFERCYDHISKKYSRNGYLKYYLPSMKEVSNREKLYNLADDKISFSKIFYEIYQEIVK